MLENETAPVQETTSQPAPVPIPAPAGSEAPTQQLPTAPPTPSDDSIAPKEDWFLIRVETPGVSTKDLFHIYGADGFGDFKSKEDYWKSSKVQKIFTDTYGSEAKLRFDIAYDDSKKEFSNFQLGQYQRSQTGYELLRDDLSALRTDVTMRFTNMAGTVMQGDDWSAPTKDYRENFNFVKTKQTDADGVTSYVLKPYSPELLKELEQDASFGGLAYSDAFYGIDPNQGVNGLYYNAIHDGQILDEASGKLKDVRNDQVVSRWDIDTGKTNVLGIFKMDLNNVLKNNKLQADGPMDYAKILVRAPINMAVNVLDTAVQLARAGVAGVYGVSDLLIAGDLDVRKDEAYKWLTTKGIKLKGKVTSQSREALQDGFFGSLESALTTTADIALQVALAGGLGRAAAGGVEIIGAGVTAAERNQIKARAAEVFVRGTLTSLAVKDSYNEAIENGYTTNEASVISGAMAVAMWHATKYASYILGDYEAKIIRQDIATAMGNEQKGILKTLFDSVPKGAADAAETKAKYSLASMKKAVSEVFGDVVNYLPSQRMIYAARQESLEEMTEELFQDGVKQAASAYGYLINNAHVAGQGRYLSIFDPGYFKNAIERYATSGIAGGIGGPMGSAITGQHGAVSTITSASTVTEILLDGKKDELISVLEELKSTGALGPKNLSVEYNEVLQTFEPVIQGNGAESLADMVFNTYMHDINVIDTFINKGMFGRAKDYLDSSENMKAFVDNNSMKKDYVKLMGSLIDFHTKNPSISTAIYDDIDKMSEEDLATRMPPEVLAGHTQFIANKKKEIADIRASIKDIDPEGAAASAKVEAPKTEDKDDKKKNIIGESAENKLTRLEKELKIAENVSRDDINKMLSSYRKIRAISTGAAAEHYLMQNELIDNKVLGARYNREKEYESLSDEPLKDMLMKMRLRYLEDEKIHVQTEVKAAELEAKISAFSKSDEESIKELRDILKRSNMSLLSEKALKSIIKMYSKADFKETGKVFSVDDEDSIFDKDENGKATDKSILEIYKEMLTLAGENSAIMEEFPEELDSALEKDPKIARQFFKSLAKDPKKATIPVWELTDDGKAKLNDLYAIDFVKAVVSSTNARFTKALKLSGDEVIELHKLKEAAEGKLVDGTFYKKEPFKRQGINALFKRLKGDSLTRQSIVDDGLSVVRSLLDSGHEGIYTYSEHAEIDDILSQIDVRLEMANVLGSFSDRSGRGNHYMNMLADFRGNVLDLIDFKYKYNSTEDTGIETHSYKDYTVMSDFFVDFMYDPIKAVEVSKKDRAIWNDAETEISNNVDRAYTLAGIGVVKDESIEAGVTQPTIEDIIAIDNRLDEESFFTFLDGHFKDDIKRATTFFETAKTLDVPNTAFGINDTVKSRVFFDGAVKLLAGKWLFKKTRDIIMTVADRTTVLPYIQAKDNDIVFTSTVFGNMISAPEMPELEAMIAREVPEYELLTRKGLSTLPKTEVGALNIQVENALFKIYNNLVENPLLEEEYTVIKEKIEEYIYKVSSSIQNNLYDPKFVENHTDTLKTFAILVGAVSTDFTPFYSKFKRDIIAMDADSNIVVAAQENAAKYAGAYIYSPLFKEMSDVLTKHRRTNSFDSAISAVFVMGKAGSGKSSAVIKLGLKLAMEIVADSGNVNTAVLPVSKYKSQVDIVTKGVGDLRKGLRGYSVDELITLLTDAVQNKNEEAIATLLEVGVIAIDEATYVTAAAIGDNIPEIETIDYLIREFNKAHNGNSTSHEIGLLLLGDPKQSGAQIPGADGSLYPATLDLRRVHPLAYMDFSFRSRNNFLTDSISTISQSITDMEKAFAGTSDLIVAEGTKYGVTAGKYFGVNIIDAADKSSSEELFSILNNSDIVDNIESNILKTIAANEARKLEGKEENAVFEVLIAPDDIVTYNENPSKLKALSEKEGYAKYFKVVTSAEVGGSEANYVIGEITSPDTGLDASTYKSAVAKSLNTMVTRAFDYAYIINRSPVVVLPVANASVRMPDDTVRIPDSTLDGIAKEGLRQNYLKIFKNIKEGDPIIVKKTVVVPVEEPFVLNKDKYSAMFAGISNFTVGEKALLTAAGAQSFFGKLNEEDTTQVLNYLNEVRTILAPGSTLSEEELAAKVAALDEVARGIKEGGISEEAFDSLVGLQVFSLTVLENYAATDILRTSLDSTIEFLNLGQKLLSDETDPSAPGVLVYDLVADAVAGLDDITMQSTNNNLFLASIELAGFGDVVSLESTDARLKYNALLDLYIEDNFNVPIGDLALFTSEDGNGSFLRWLDAAILAKATFLKTELQTKLPDVDKADILSYLSDFEEWIYDMKDIDIAKELLSQLHVDSTATQLSIPPLTAELFSMGYSVESVKKELYDVVEFAKRRLEADLEESTIYGEVVKTFNRLKDKLGLQAYTNSKTLYTKITELDTKVRAELESKAATEESEEKLNDIAEIIDAWNTLYGSGSSVFGESNYGKGFIKRRTSYLKKEELEDYKADALEMGIMHTVKLTKFNKPAAEAVNIPKDGSVPKKQVALNHAKALKLFNFKNTLTGEVPKKVIMRAVRRSKNGIPTIDLLVMASTFSTNYVISQVDMNEASPDIRSLVHDIEKIMSDPKSDKTFKNTHTVSKVVKVKEVEKVINATYTDTIMDIEIPGNIKDFLYTKPGQSAIESDVAKDIAKGTTDRYMVPPIPLGEGYKELTIKDLTGGPTGAMPSIRVSKTMYVDTHKPVAGEDRTNKVGNLRGEAFVLYSTNLDPIADLDSSEIINTIKSGQGLDSKAKIMETKGNLNSQLGVLRVMLRAPLDALGAVIKANPQVIMGQFTSNFSLALQQHFIESVKDYKVGETKLDVYVKKHFVYTEEFKNKLAGHNIGDTVFFNIDGANRSFIYTSEISDYAKTISPGNLFTFPLEEPGFSHTYTAEVASFMSEMNEDFNRYFATKGDEHRKAVTEALDKMKAAYPAELDELAKAFVLNKLRVEEKTNSRKYDIIYKSSTGGYIFNINEYLKNHPESILKKVDALATLANYALKPNIKKGTNVYAGFIDPIFMEKLAEYIYVPSIGIKMPSLIITKDGIASIGTAIKAQQVSNTEEEAVLTYEQGAVLDTIKELNEKFKGLDDVKVVSNLLSLGISTLNNISEQGEVIKTLIANDPRYADDHAAVINVLSVVQENIRRIEILEEPEFRINDFLPEHARDLQDSVYRDIASELIIGYSTKNNPSDLKSDPARVEILISALEALSRLVEGSEKDAASLLVSRGLVEDKDIINILNNCKLS